MLILMITTYILMILLIFSFTLNPFLKKQASKHVTTYEFIIIYQILAISLVIGFIFYLLKYKKCSLACFKKLSNTDLVWTLLAVITGILGSILLLYLLKQDEVSFIIPNVQAMVILLGSLIGFFIFNEKINIYKSIGLLLIIVGIICLNYGKLTTS